MNIVSWAQNPILIIKTPVLNLHSALMVSLKGTLQVWAICEDSVDPELMNGKDPEATSRFWVWAPKV